MASSAANQVMAEKTNNQTSPNHHQQQQPLQCPRCNSSNTKFCYYNNYSLSQPRHFCKACKRYWTRGGTLRNVPIGGGCRKNKRLKRLPSSGGDGIPAAAASTGTANPKINLSPLAASNHINYNNPLFYSLPTNNNNPLEPLNYFPFSNCSSTRVCDNNNNSNNNRGFGFQPQIINGSLGLGFSSSGLMPNELPNKQISSTGNNSIFFGYSASTMASLLKIGTNGGNFKDMIFNEVANGGSGLMPYDDHDHDHQETQEILNRDQNGSGRNKEVKFELGSENRLLGWNNNPNTNNPNPLEQINSSDPSSLIWNTTNIGSWFDLSNSNMDSSVPSLI